ncbi:uncharacterized protein LOC143295468 [Babylonia areolata]|uniref:uncharacterized protein LOC143295468 n=1 Tax=Babylonia areolata TaxID=304850 RepID=UPI003FD1F213
MDKFSGKKHILHLVALVALLAEPRHQGLCFFGSNLPNFNYYGKLESDYSLYYVGEVMTLHCYKDSSFNGSVTFKAGNTVLGNGTKINSTCAYLDKVVTADDFSVSFYSCSDSTNALLKQKKIFVDYAPQNATHVEMVWLDKDDITVRWKFGPENITFKNSHEKVILIRAEWRQLRFGEYSTWQQCVNATTSCSVKDFTDPYSSVSVRVNVTNVKRRQSVITVLPELLAMDYAKPKPVRLTEAKAVSNRIANLTVQSNWPRLKYNIFICTPASTCSVVSTALTKDHELTVKDLHPSYIYTFHVQAAFDRGFFSESSNAVSLTMPEDAPSSAPAVTPGAFFVDRTGCTRSSPNATVYIYFQEVAGEDQNGQIRNYTGEVRLGQHRFEVHSTAEAACTLRAEHLNCDREFSVTIYASTAAGRSPSTLLTVPQWNEKMHKKVENLDLRLRLEGGQITAEWTPDDDMVNHTLFLYFCKRDPNNPNQCQEAIGHKKVKNPLAGRATLGGDASMMFGVAVVTQGGITTGIVMSSCIYVPGKELGETIEFVQLRPQRDTMEVVWRGPERCKASRQVIVLNYVIELCQDQQASPCATYTVDGSISRYKLTEVTAGTMYHVKVAANTTGGMTEPVQSESAKLLEQTKEALTGGAIAGIASAVLIVCIIAGACLFLYCRSSMQERKKKFSKQIKTPSFQEHRGRVVGVDNRGASIPDDSLQDDHPIHKFSPPLVPQTSSSVDSGCDVNSPPVTPTPASPEPEPVPGPDPQPPARGAPLGPAPDPTPAPTPTSLEQDCSTTNPEDNSSSTDPVSQGDSGSTSITPYVIATNVAPPDESGDGGGVLGSEVGVVTPPTGGWGQGGEQMVFFVVRPELPHAAETASCGGEPKKQNDVASYVTVTTAGPVRPDLSGDEEEEEDEDSHSTFGEQFDELTPRAHEDVVVAEPQPSKEAGTRMNPAYVQYPLLLQSTDPSPQVLADLTTDSRIPEQCGVAGLHSGYISHAAVSSPHINRSGEREEGNEDGGQRLAPAEETPTPSSQRQVGRKREGGRGEPAGDGYLPLSSVPGAICPPASHLSVDTCSEISDSITLPELPDDGIDDNSSTSIGDVEINDDNGNDLSIDVSYNTELKKGSRGPPMVNSNGYVFFDCPPLSSGEHKAGSGMQQIKLDDNGYVHLPSPTSGDCPGEQKVLPHNFMRLDSGYISPLPEPVSPTSWQQH